MSGLSARMSSYAIPSSPSASSLMFVTTTSDAGDQLLEHRAPVGAVDLEPDAALLRTREVQRGNGVASYRLVELSREPARTSHAQRVGSPCRLHPDDVGAELCEVARRDRGGNAIAEFEDAEPNEWQPRLAAIVHARGTLLSRRDDFCGM